MSRLELIESIKKSVRTERERQNADLVYFTILNDGRTNFAKLGAQVLSDNIEYIIVCAFRVYYHRHGTSNYIDTITIINKDNSLSDEINLSRLTIKDLKFKMDDNCQIRHITSATIYSNDDLNNLFTIDLTGRDILFDSFWKLFVHLDSNFTPLECELFFNYFRTKLIENDQLTIQEYKDSYQKLIS